MEVSMAIVVVLVISFLVFPEQCTEFSVLTLSAVALYSIYQAIGSYYFKLVQTSWLEKEKP
jgi:hypothetical protein